MSDKPDEMIDATEAAALWGQHVLPRHVRQWAADGLLSVRRLPGTRPLYSRREVEALVERFVSRPTSAS
jgi:hypothetical protein